MKITLSQLRQIIKEEVAKTITGYPGELPVDVDKTTALERYREQMSSLASQISKASTPAEKQELQGQLSDVTKAHVKLAQS